MKRFLSLCFLAVLLLSTGLTAYAAEQPQLLSQTTTALENGITFTDTITVYSQSRSTDKGGNKTRTFKDGDTVITTITLEGKLTKWLVFNNSFTMTLSCDKNGNLS